MPFRALLLLTTVLLYASACTPQGRCYRDPDCPAPQVCGVDGVCAYRCSKPADCGAGFTCLAHLCVPEAAGDVSADAAELSCPADMVLIANSFCIDRWEASRLDATALSFGTDGSKAMSRAGVRPWLVPDNATAQAACTASGRRLCAPAEWEFACRGFAGHVYAYGDTYEPATCNGIDTHRDGSFSLAVTGAFPKCHNGLGVFDLNGNVWEHVAGGDGKTVRGGAYNCSDSNAFHRCAYVPQTWTPSALGFRCCVGPVEDVPDAAIAEVADTAAPVEDAFDVEAAADEEGGCLDPDVSSSDIAGPDVSVLDVADPDPDTGVDLAPDPGPDSDVLPAACPPEMVTVTVAATSAVSCIDRWEASRTDATAQTQGTTAVAASQAGVLPWYPVNLATAQTACAAAGKRLCTPAEWFDACRGPDQTAYSYGNDYVADTCNGIDAFCACTPYPKCIYTCGGDFHPVPTGSFAKCTNAWGVFDINGNVWELVDWGDGIEHFRGGAFNCSDSAALHRCDYDATWGPSARGFRCCRDL